MNSISRSLRKIPDLSLRGCFSGVRPPLRSPQNKDIQRHRIGNPRQPQPSFRRQYPPYLNFLAERVYLRCPRPRTTTVDIQISPTGETLVPSPPKDRHPGVYQQREAGANQEGENNHGTQEQTGPQEHQHHFPYKQKAVWKRRSLGITEHHHHHHHHHTITTSSRFLRCVIEIVIAVAAVRSRLEAVP